MEYHEAVGRLERLRTRRPKLGTETTAELLGHLGDPHEGLTAVQVAGSNGKGSTATVLARVLKEAGLTVGLYTSPDLNDLRERVRVDGRKVPQHAVADFVEEAWPHVVEQAADGDEPTFFEAFTAMALWEFDRRDVDVAVLEVGIGGRYDATSVVDPVASAVTSVSLEHTDILGSTVAEIARDKAQVAPADAPLVTGAGGDALAAIREETDVVTVGGDGDGGVDAARADVVAEHGEFASSAAVEVSIEGRDWAVDAQSSLLGAHQARNVGVAAALAMQVGASTGATVTTGDVAAGVRNATVPGRFEVLDDSPLVVLDGAHNPAACRTLAETLAWFDYDDLHVVFGAMRDKDHAGMCGALPPVDAAYLAAPAVDRAQGTDVLAAVFDRETDASVAAYGSVLDAVHDACEAAGEDDCVLVAGSLYVVGAARDRWTRAPRLVDASDRAAARRVLSNANVPASVRADRVDDLGPLTVRLHARRDEAAALSDAMADCGGTAAVSGIAAPDRHVDVVLSGTRAAFRELLAWLRDRGGDAVHLAACLEDVLGDDGPSVDAPWGDGTAVMGVLNVTPDSFHDGGEYEAVEDAVARAEAMVDAGADVVDVGGESTRPGAEPVSVAAERARVVPVVEALRDVDAAVSVDTRKPAVAEAALEAGADAVNDVTGLSDAAMRSVLADWDVPVVVMHSVSAPVEPGERPDYDDVVDDVFGELAERLLLAERAGVDRSRVVVDPGLGFGKSAADSFALLDRVAEFRALGAPVLVGHSHKSMFEAVDCGPAERLPPTLAATALAAERGADVVRVHDVAANAAAVATAARTVADPKHDVSE
ncbi:dihydropteroate synthase [Halobacterium yunchengense]|uniref:dihydropteroate synthase n=1 Tax=Halobacterium yunchengense TaxID=3108497 RepID=UPI003009F5A5